MKTQSSIFKGLNEIKNLFSNLLVGETKSHNSVILPTDSKIPSYLTYDDSLELEFINRKKSGKTTPGQYQDSFRDARIITDTFNKLFYERKVRVLIVCKQMQAGKTSVVKTFIDTSLSNKFNKDEILFTSGYCGVELREMNAERLGNSCRVESVRILLNLVESNKEDLSDLKFLIIDEKQIGEGDKGQIHLLLGKLIDKYEDLMILYITATPGGLSEYPDYPILWLEESSNYYGIPRMLQNGQIKDIRDLYLECSGDGKPTDNPYFFEQEDEREDVVDLQLIKPTFAKDLKRLCYEDDGAIGIIRYSHPLNAKSYVQKYLSKNGLKNRLEILCAHSNSDKTDNNNGIAQTIDLACKKALDGSNILLIVHNSFQAGYDMDNGVPEMMKTLKCTVKQKGIFGYETTLGNANSILQGIPGRFCGYHNNKKLTIYANLGVCKTYSELANKKITIQEYDEKIGSIFKSKGNSTVAQATHINKKSRVVKKHHSTKTIALSFPGKIIDWKPKDIQKEISKHSKEILCVGDGFISNSLSELLINCINSNLHSLNNENHQVTVGKDQGVTDSKGLFYYPNGKAQSNNKVQTQHLEREIQKAKDGEMKMSSFTQRSANNPNLEKINVGILFNDGDGKNEIIVCLKDKLFEECEIYDVKDTSMNKDTSVTYF